MSTVLDSRRRQELLAQVRGMALPPLDALFATLLAGADDVLFDHAASAGPSQLVFLDGMRELRRSRETVQAAWRRHLEQAWARFADGQVVSAEQALGSGAEAGLSLVPEHVLESRLAVRQFAATLLRTFAPVLQRLDQRLGRLIGERPLEADGNPLGPEHLAVALHLAFIDCELATEVRVLLIKRCERDMPQALARLYDAVDAHLAAAGVLPAMPSDRPRRPLSDAAGGPPRAAQSGSAERAAPPAAATDEAGDPAQVLHSLQALLRHARSLREEATAAARTAVEQQRPLSQREMLTVLSLLQAAPVASVAGSLGGTEQPLAERLRHELLSGASQLGLAPGQTRLDAEDEDAVELVGRVFDVLLGQQDLDGRPRALMERLVVPFVKVALLDRSLFVQQSHPARRLLDALAEACAGATGDGGGERALMEKVEEVIDRLVAEFNENLTIFQVLEDEFSEFMVQHRRRVEIAERRVAETQRGQEKLERARVRAAQEVQRLASGQPLPVAFATFLQQPWQHHLILAALREGEQGAGVTQSLALAEALLADLQRARSGAGMSGWPPSRSEQLASVFASVGLQGDAVTRAVDALRATLLAIADGHPERQPTLPDLPLGVLPGSAQGTTGHAPAPEPDASAYDPAEAERLRALPVGSWLDFIGEDGKVQAAKLAWISPISARLLFVNRRGGRFCVASAEELAVLVTQQRLHPHVDDSAFASALQQVIAQLTPEPGTTLH